MIDNHQNTTSRELIQLEKKKFTAEEVLTVISESMDNSERWDLLEQLYDLYYSKKKATKERRELASRDVIVDKEAIESFLHYLSDKADDVYHSEVNQAVQRFIFENKI